jgi:hypothetical protein
MTLAQQNGITQFPYIIKDEKGNRVYFEEADGYWYKSEYNANCKETYYENSIGFWRKAEYNAIGKVIYYANSGGTWYKKEYDDSGNVIYYEDYEGTIIDEIPKKPVNHSKIQLTI